MLSAIDETLMADERDCESETMLMAAEVKGDRVRLHWVGCE
jgi:hypothetical protein